MDRRRRITASALAHFREHLVECPGCKNGLTVDPNYCGQDPLCKLCHGVKVVCRISCRCGRPLRLDGKGEVNGKFCCGRKKCMEAIQPAEDSPQIVYSWSGQHNPWHEYEGAM